jgi:hypothetical protein
MKTLIEFIGESKQSKHPIFAGLKLPSGRESSYDHVKGEYRWVKHGGYADAPIKSLSDSIDKQRWKKLDPTDHSSPDGNVMGLGTHYRNGEHVLSMHSLYGSTKHNNYHTISLVHKPVKK